MKRFVFASHHSMATGMKDTMEFLTKSEDPIYDISAYMNEAQDEDLAAVVAELFATFDPEDKVVIMTDLMRQREPEVLSLYEWPCIPAFGHECAAGDAADDCG